MTLLDHITEVLTIAALLCYNTGGKQTVIC